MAKTVTIYRDNKTGRFAKKSAWKRDKKRGGERYTRKRYVKKRPTPPPPPPPPEGGEIHEWVMTFTYDKTGRSFDVIVTASNETTARTIARDFLRTDPKGRNIARSKYAGWRMFAAEGNISDQDEGEAEYREDSEDE